MSPCHMHSKLSKCSQCNTQKSGFYIHCCSTCHAFPRSHMNLGIAQHTLFIHGIWMCVSLQTSHPTTHRTRFTLISTPCAPPTIFKAAGTDVSGRVSPPRLWRRTCSAYHKRRLEGLCQRAGALITDAVAKEIQFGDGHVGLVLKQPWHMLDGIPVCSLPGKSFAKVCNASATQPSNCLLDE